MMEEAKTVGDHRRVSGLLPHEQMTWLRTLGWYHTGSHTPWCWHHPRLPAIYRLKDAYRIAKHEAERA